MAGASHEHESTLDDDVLVARLDAVTPARSACWSAGTSRAPRTAFAVMGSRARPKT